MGPFGYLYAASIMLAAGLAMIGIWAPRKAWVRLSALALALGFMPLGYLGLADLLGKPKPAAVEVALRDLAEATVISSVLRQDVAIYLWLRLPETTEPRAYVLPWNQALAEQLHEAQGRAARQGTEVRIRRPFRNSLEEREPMAYAPPQEAPPLKRAPDGGPVVLAHPSTGG